MGLAPNVTSGCYVMRSDGTIELTSNITDDTPLGEQEEVLEEGAVPKQAGPQKKPPKTWEEKTPDERMLEAVMGWEGGNHPVFADDFEGHWKPEDDLPPDDPLQCRKVRRAVTKEIRKLNKKWVKR